MKRAAGIILLYLFIGLSLRAQPLGSASEWEKKLSLKSDRRNLHFSTIESILLTCDSATTFQFLDALEQKTIRGNQHFIARFNCLKARQLYEKYLGGNLDRVKQKIKLLFVEALNHAYESGDEYLVAFVSHRYGGLVYHLGETELAVMYMLNAVELNEKLYGRDEPQNYRSLGELFYEIKEYENCVKFSRKAAEITSDTSMTERSAIMSCYNTTALGYHRQGKYDSAFFYYRKALDLAHEIKNEVWKGIISGNMGQVYFEQKRYDTALALLEYDYKTSLDAGYLDNASNSLQWAARAKLAMGDNHTALKYIRESILLNRRWPMPAYTRNIYYTAGEIFKGLGQYDSALHYHQLHARLNDSLERVASLSGIAVSKARLNDERSRYSILDLQREKKQQLLQRNILIAGIVLLTIIAILIVNRQRLRARLRVETLLQEKHRMEQEMANAREQLDMFTQHIIEKTTLIEKLEEQARDRVATADQQQLIEELSRQTILTEEEWVKFKMLFEKIHPGFFTRLREKASDITIAEQRMAALTKLHLTIPQMAAMLGISADSARKGRLRLKQRLGILENHNLEDLINQL